MKLRRRFVRFAPPRPTAAWGLSLVLCGALLVAACGSKVELLSQISESQANDVLAALSGHGIAADKVSGKEGMVSVSVPGDKVAQAIDILHSEGLPRRPYASLGDVFRKDGLISSPLEERARLVYALSQELSNTISKIDGVIYAQVHVVLPERGGFGETSDPASAAVFIKYQDSVSLDGVVPQIRRLVANSIPDLDYDHVSVVLVPSVVTAASPPPVADGATDAVWGLKVAPDSARTLRIVLGACSLLTMGSLGGLVLWIVRAKLARKTAEPHHA